MAMPIAFADRPSPRPPNAKVEVDLLAERVSHPSSLLGRGERLFQLSARRIHFHFWAFSRVFSTGRAARSVSSNVTVESWRFSMPGITIFLKMVTPTPNL